jgi:predicted AlkP superfamily pyrophosphatase or phosphodiesterase
VGRRVSRARSAWAVAAVLGALTVMPAGGALKASGSPAGAPAAPRVVIVSWDGAKPAVLGTLLAAGRLPTLKNMVETGAYTFRARTIVPSLTLPSHVSMLTGVTPDRHHVTWNGDRPGAALGVPTIFRLAKAAGLRTAVVYGKRKLGLLDQPGAVDAAQALAAAAVQDLRTAVPDLLFVHFRQPDDAGHDHGWGDTAAKVPPSPQYEAALEACDRATGDLVAALRADGRWAQTLLILTADHGGRGTSHGGSDPQETTIPWVAAGGLAARPGPIPGPVSICDTAATALAALGLGAPSGWTGVLGPQPVERIAF